MSENLLNTGAEDMQAAFIRAAIWHGQLTEADSMLALYPELAGLSIHTAAILGNASAVRDFLSADPALVASVAGPYGGNALVYCCMSKYLRLEKERSDAFLDTARILLEAGADPNSGFWTKGAYPEFETALYGAAGIAHHAELTKLLLAHGGDPNDVEAVYHSPETYENDAMIALVETGNITDVHLVLMLIRKHDLHDYAGVKYLLEKGVDPNGRWSYTSAFHHALMRCNHISIISLSLDHGADPALVCQDLSAAARAAREGRSDVLAEFQRRRLAYHLQDVDKLIEACAFGDHTLANSILQQKPSLLSDLMALSGTLLAKFSGAGNVKGVRQLLDLGVKVDTPFAEGDGYFEIPKMSLAIHVAAWRAQHDVVQLLIERGSPIDIPDSKGRSPLQLAIKASVDSYWTDRRSTKSAELLLDAGARFDRALLPTGYQAMDELLSTQ
ncbi:ankyrin repeat domain-containing protein [Dyadobacter sp. CY107]|uniref:ankyrin repeat domain-containing protein n=1 Tax=Dyadobacter fanqingshengii TaxID=2906443 RepID=UPI001F407F36|nr:ankyrin repeat domain-containing protein [Dyadobacter fanqingshengii]MCF2505611.1 ankyrin repeat domain-containing protein [Dyadobacter fanqingshengii]